MRLVITGGHHTSALPVIEHLKRLDPNIQLYWLGHKHSMKANKNYTLEYQEISSLGIPFKTLHAGKFYRTFDLRRLIKIPFGFFQAFYYLCVLRPDAILSFGGYLAVPVVLAGWFLRIPSITHEQTVVSGYSNKLISNFAKKILISWEQSRKYFPSTKVVFTGLPLRKDLYEVRSSVFSVNTSLPTLYITAGKTGSHKINMFIYDILADLLLHCNVIHQCGNHSGYNDYMYLEALQQSLQKDLPGTYFLRKNVGLDEIGEVFSKASLFLSRAGAHIISEILTFKKHAVLIPIPWVSHNEQNLNAGLVVDAGLGVVLQEKGLTSEVLLKSLLSALNLLDPSEPPSSQPVYDTTPAVLIAKEVFKLF